MKNYIVITTWTLIKLEVVRLLFWSRCRERLSELLHVLHITLRGSERHMVPIRNISSFWVSHGTRQFHDFQLIRSFRFHFQFTSFPLCSIKPGNMINLYLMTATSRLVCQSVTHSYFPAYFHHIENHCHIFTVCCSLSQLNDGKKMLDFSLRRDLEEF